VESEFYDAATSESAASVGGGDGMDSIHTTAKKGGALYLFLFHCPYLWYCRPFAVTPGKTV
jgi:hypothetical protein